MLFSLIFASPLKPFTASSKRDESSSNILKVISTIINDQMFILISRLQNQPISMIYWKPKIYLTFRGVNDVSLTNSPEFFIILSNNLIQLKQLYRRSL